MQPMDWNATAAWIALAISITGTIASPLITTWLTNRHQLKIFKLEANQHYLDLYESRRHEAITAFLSEVGTYISTSHAKDAEKAGRVFHGIYPYLSPSDWELFDKFHDELFSYNQGSASSMYPEITHKLGGILKEEPRLLP